MNHAANNHSKHEEQLKPPVLRADGTAFEICIVLQARFD
jgi:hypothetical protein